MGELELEEFVAMLAGMSSAERNSCEQKIPQVQVGLGVLISGN